MEFQPEKESWDSYAERLEHFFTATRMVDDEKKVFTLIHQNGPSLYTLLKELSFPNNPTQMSYNDIMEILRRHYVGAKSVFYERKLFYRAQMKPYESASEWHRRLRALVINCDFCEFLEEILVDKFVTGFQGKVLQRLYEQDATLSLQRALEIAQRYENDSTSVGQAKRNKERSTSENRQKLQQQQPNRSHQQQQQPGQQQQQQKQPEQQQRQPQHQQRQSQHQQRQQQHQQRQSQQQQGQPQPQYRQREQQQIQPGQQQQWQQQPQQNLENRQQFNQHGQAQQGRRNVPTCYKCGKQGHYANVCRSQIRKEEEKSDCCIS